MAQTLSSLSAEAIQTLLSSGGRIAVRVTPNAKTSAVQLAASEQECPRLDVRVAVPPEDGKANEAVIALLAKALGIRKSALTIVQGHTTRNKLIQIGS